MTTITLPPDIEAPLAEEARQQGTTTELLALDKLRKMFPPSPPETTQPSQDGETLYNFLQGYVGTIEGTTEPLSEDTGRRFADSMVQRHCLADGSALQVIR